MAVATLKLDLAPPSNYWRLNHVMLSWTALALGGLVLAGSLGLTWVAYQHAAQAGKLAGSLANKTRSTADAQTRVLAELRSIDVTRELPRWRLAERIYTERSLPWSRLTSELERSLVKDVRIKAIQRNRSADLKVQLKLSGEARTRDAEAAFMDSLQKNAFFEQVILEREGERPGGGVDFNYTLAAASVPPPYRPLPKGPAAAAPRPGAAKVPAPQAPQAPQTPHAPQPGIAVPPPVRPAPAAPAQASPPPLDPRYAPDSIRQPGRFLAPGAPPNRVPRQRSSGSQEGEQ